MLSLLVAVAPSLLLRQAQIGRAYDNVKNQALVSATQDTRQRD